MKKPVQIGDDLREAIDWLQDLVVTTRPSAENGMIRMLSEGAAITTNDGVFLVEDEEETLKKFPIRKQRRSRARTFSKHCYKHKSQQYRESISNTIKNAAYRYTDAFGQPSNEDPEIPKKD